ERHDHSAQQLQERPDVTRGRTDSVAREPGASRRNRRSAGSVQSVQSQHLYLQPQHGQCRLWEDLDRQSAANRTIAVSDHLLGWVSSGEVPSLVRSSWFLVRPWSLGRWFVVRAITARN